MDRLLALLAEPEFQLSLLLSLLSTAVLVYVVFALCAKFFPQKEVMTSEENVEEITAEEEEKRNKRNNYMSLAAIFLSIVSLIFATLNIMFIFR